MKKIVIFDLDGTLLNTIADLTDSINYTLNKFSYPTKTIQEVTSYVGNGVPKLVERAIPNGLNNSNFAQCLKCFKTYYLKNMYNKTKPYNGIIEMLKELNSLNIIIGVSSNKFDGAVKELCNKYFEGA